MAEPPSLCVRAPAKVNVYLEVVGRRPDGYHDIRTVMQAVSLCDELEFALRPSGRVEIWCDAPGVPSGEENLVLRAVRLMADTFGMRSGVAIRLSKGIPAGGGLGGGSSDAAVTLLALNHLWGVRAPVADLVPLAARLGSDVPFFLWGGAALCEGRGERVTPVACGATMHYALAMPGFPVSTAAVYGALETPLTDSGDGSHNVLRALSQAAPQKLGDHLRNDLEEPALSLSQDLRRLRADLVPVCRACDARGLVLSGSGSSYVMVLGGGDAARRAAEHIAALGLEGRAVRSVAAWNGSVLPLTSGRRLP